MSHKPFSVGEALFILIATLVLVVLCLTLPLWYA